MLCIPIIFNNLLKTWFSNKNLIKIYYYNPDTNVKVNFLLKNKFLTDKIIGAQNQLPITY